MEKDLFCQERVRSETGQRKEFRFGWVVVQLTMPAAGITGGPALKLLDAGGCGIDRIYIRSQVFTIGPLAFIRA